LGGIDKLQLNPSKLLLSRHRIAPFGVSKTKIGRKDSGTPSCPSENTGLSKKADIT
jgi:hypothetical protein